MSVNSSLVGVKLARSVSILTTLRESLLGTLTPLASQDSPASAATTR